MTQGAGCEAAYTCLSGYTNIGAWTQVSFALMLPAAFSFRGPYGAGVMQCPCSFRAYERAHFLVTCLPLKYVKSKCF